ncbi:MAG: hypothetical protein J1G06_10100, partial [Oscillospiraceae bacterium]|nr:hypothetical protein [Oscillospiraceae bacterium]
MRSKKLIAFVTAVSTVAAAFTGIGIGSQAADAEKFYNFSSLTEEKYAKGGADVFDGALHLTGTEDAKPLSVNTSVVTPSGSSESITSALITKKLSVTVHLEAGETVVEYYCGSDSAGAAQKNIDMVVKNAAGSTVASEDNLEQKGESVKPYTISYRAETAGDYTIVDGGSSSNRTIVYAVAVTSGEYDPGATSVPATQNPNATAVPTATPKPTVDPNAKAELTITREAGWLESAYVTWTNPVAVDGYNVYVKPDGGAYTKIDDELVRYYGSYYRADALGLKAGKYQMKVAAVVGGKEVAEAESGVVTVEAHIREGFAFDPSSSHYNKDGVGAYKNDGTLKDGAKVLYITDKNKDTVELDVITDTTKNTVTTGVGLCDILSLREKNKAETTPLVIRLIGQVEAPSGINSSKYAQIKATSNVTLEGVGDDAATYHWSLLIRDTNNIEVRNIAVMEFYDDGISLDTANFNDWIHNVDIFYGQDRGSDQKKGDGSLDVKSGSDYCTFSYNHFWDSGKTSLCGMKEDNNQGYHMTYFGNWFDHSDSRHPRVRGDQVHVYNNFYDGISKYGVGACTGSSVYVEKNVFRNAVHPVLISMQGTDAQGDGTFSDEDGGIIKMYDNQIVGGIPVIYASESNTNDFDAYLAKTREETVPSTYKTKQGGTTYSNFDTASNMYAYTPFELNEVVAQVTKYAGRIENGDFTHEFNDEVDDALYDRDPVLGKALQSYKTTLKTEYATGAEYPETEGAQPTARPTTDPTIPTEDPNKPTAAPETKAYPITWDFGAEPFTVTEGDSVHPDTKYFPAGSTSGRYNITSSSIKAADFGGLNYKLSGTSENNYQASGKSFSDGFKGTWQIKTGTGDGSSVNKAFTFIPVVDGTVTVYARSGSSDKDSTLNIFQGTEKITATLKSTGSEGSDPLPVVEMEIVADKEVQIYGSGNIGFYAIKYSSDKPLPTADPTQTENPDQPTDKPSDQPTTQPTDKPSDQPTTQPADPTATPVPCEPLIPLTVTALPKGTTANFESVTDNVTVTGPTVLTEYVAVYAGTHNEELRKIDVDGSNKSFDNKSRSYTRRLKLGGAVVYDVNGAPGMRTISVTPAEAGALVIDFAHASSSGDARTIAAYQNGAEIGTMDISAGATDTFTVVVAAGSPVYIYSKVSGINIYGITLIDAADMPTPPPSQQIKPLPADT